MPPAAADSQPDEPNHRLATAACVAFVLFGTLVRIYGVATNGALWMDELFLANNLRELSFGELLSPLKYGQNAPVGWLWLEKLTITLLGDSEIALRLPVLVASILSLPLTMYVARRAVGLGYAVIPVAIVSCSPFVIWQGIQVKQYSFDLLVGLSITLLAMRALSGRSMLALATAGFFGIWISMPAIFAAAAAGIVLLWHSVRATPKNWRRTRAIVAMGAVWLAAFGANYFAFLRPRSQAGWLYEYWAPGLFPWPADELADLWWLPRVLADALSDPTGFLGIGAAALVPVLLGAVAMCRRRTFTEPTDAPTRAAPSRLVSSLVGLPVLLTLIAAIAAMYPFTVRLVLFLVPAFTILFALGVRWAARIAPPGIRSLVHVAAAALVAVPLVLCLLWLPRGGLPIAAQTDQLFARFESVDRAEPIFIEHIASHAWRYYGSRIDRQVLELPEAWDTEPRVRAVHDTLSQANQSPVWIALIRVTDRRPETLGQALQADLESWGFTFPRVYDWLVEERTGWARVEAFERAIPAGWQITERVQFDGCRLWRLQR